MTPQEIAEVRPRLLDFAAEMLGGLARKDQRAAGELYVRGLLTGGRRKSMVAMAARLGTDHQRLQQFITSSTWDYASVRRNVARWFAASQPGGARPVVVADAGYGDNAAFRLDLAARGWRYVLAVKGTTSAHAHGAVPATLAYGGLGRPSVPRYRAKPVSLRQLAIAHADKIQPVTWRQGTRAAKGNRAAAMTSHFLAIGVRPASRDIPRADDGSLPDCWLLAEWPSHAGEPTDYWLSILPADTPIAELVRLAKIRWRAGHDYRELKTGPGLDHFEGRSYLGWHRHVTLAVLAQAFCTMIRTDPKVPAPG